VTQLVRAQGGEAGAVNLVLDLSPTRFEIDQAIPCGLIVNELVTNSLKHGFPKGLRGDIRVSLGHDDEGCVRLEVRDNGVGLPADFEGRRDKSLGLQLVSDLARQIGGKLTIARGDPGASFCVVLPSPRLETVPIVLPAGRAIA
jgi:two-component sensor histidine kinase